MFPRLQNTPYVGVDAGEFFQKICGNNIDGDVTFLSTMRALLYDRMGEGDTVGFDYSSSTYSKCIYPTFAGVIEPPFVRQRTNRTFSQFP